MPEPHGGGGDEGGEKDGQAERACTGASREAGSSSSPSVFFPLSTASAACLGVLTRSLVFCLLML